MDTEPHVPRLALAGESDIADLAALARAELPTMTALHDEAGWTTYKRFGTGRQARESWTVVLRDEQDEGELVGFAWVDDSMFTEGGITEPWWCINALVVAPKWRGQGFSTQLVEAVASAARSAGVILIFGQTVPGAVTFWQRSRFTVAGPAEPLVTNNPALRMNLDPVNLTLPPGAPDRWFVRYLLTEPGSIRSGLVPASLLS